ncbi:P-type ATPase [Effusibacillus dendaii]|uniref:Cation-transporting P-type ATPase n=1 Tax=Effusibacillus dendaii TaxID=2743772 RepID=A0A7I8DEA8_9BACL|nr:cation transporting ATPase C-terminal domain-containing protein [Effusibacillus dendaii]BCJ88377.1 cation-transporting P-type ATPase [Effusibacillus dendaii]
MPGAIGTIGIFAIRLAAIPGLFIRHMLQNGSSAASSMMGQQVQEREERASARRPEEVPLADGWETGLTEQEAKRRLAAHGSNEYRPIPSHIQLLGQTLKSASTLSLLGLAVFALVMGKYVDAAIVFVTFAVLGAVSVRVKVKAAQNHRRMLETEATASVLRDGKICEIAPAYVVPGDLIFVRQGDVVPADAVVLRSEHLKVREKQVRGNGNRADFYLVAKAALDNGHLPQVLPLHNVAEANRLYAGSMVVGGSAKALVTSTGRATHHWQLHQHPKQHETFTEQRYFKFAEKLTKYGWLAILAVGVLVLAVRWSGSAALETAIAIGTSVIPGGFSLPIVLAFWTAMHRTSRKAQDLPDLHAADRLEDTKLVILSEQAVTRRIQIKKLFCPQSRWQVKPDLQDHMHTGRLRFYQNGILQEPSGRPECKALVQAAKLFARAEGDCGPYDQAVNRLYDNFGLSGAQRTDWEWIGQGVLESHGLFESRMFKDPTGRVVEVVRGPAERLYESCSRVISPLHDLANLDVTGSSLADDQAAEALQSWLETTRRHYEQTIGFACRVHADSLGEAGSLIWLGAISYQTEYETSAPLLERFVKLGLPVLLTVQEHVLSDPAFRRSVSFDGIRCKVVSAGELGRTMEQEAIDNYDLWIVSAHSEERLKLIQKLREVFSHICFVGCRDQERAYFGAAWTAVEQGIRRGLHDVLEAIEEARHAKSRISHANGFILSGNVGEAVFSLLAGLTGAQQALTPININLLTNVFASIGLAAGRRKMDRQQPTEGKNLSKLHKPIVTHGLMSGSVAMLSYAGGLLISGDPFFASTFAFATLILSQLWQAVHWRRQSRVAKLKDMVEDRVLAVSLLGSLAILVASVYMPGVTQLLQTTPLALQDWLAAMAIAGAVGPLASKSENSVWPVVKRMAGWLQAKERNLQTAA